ncbi:hypothetical protein [Salinicola halophilus]|uniref:hypothetical protein n=1 Tax=Salinicola halophilus TaxID=184065 RepID=UPI000DA12D94|nr:hypothetical protein [Salinicola halophilus]
MNRNDMTNHRGETRRRNAPVSYAAVTRDGDATRYRRLASALQARARHGTGVLLAGALATLTGCQSLSAPSPVSLEGGGALPPECQWQAGDADPLARLRATRDVVESRGYVILDTDVTLGVVSAERRTRQPGLGALNSPFGRTGLWGGVGFGGRSGYGIGLSQGFGYGYDSDPIRVERLSVATPSTITYVDRDSVVVDRDGYLIDARSDNHQGVCRELRQAIESRLTTATPAPGTAVPAPASSSTGRATP